MTSTFLTFSSPLTRLAKLGAGAFLLTALVAAPALAQGQSGSTFHEVFDGGGVFNHPCNTELVECSGHTGVMIHSSVDGQGALHLTIHFQDQDMVCIGLDSGTVYQSAYAETLHRNDLVLPCSDGCTSAYLFTWNLVSQGNADNLQVRGEAHIVFNANGEPILLNFLELHLSCG